VDILEIVQTFAATHNCTFGICDASPLDATHLQKSTFVPFVSQDIKKRTDPSTILPGAKSIIAVGVRVSDDSFIQENASNINSTAQLSTLATNDDYHIKIKSLLRELADQILQYTVFKYKILVDSPTLDERAYALRAGIGFFGRNGLVISPKFGTRFNIGLLLMDVSIGSATPTSKKECPSSCRLCIDACPNSALQLDSLLDTPKCISYLTQKRDLTDAEKTMLHNQLYGCDICQDACPFNTPYTKTYINPQDWLTMSDTEFAEKYARTAMLWQGTEILRRNAQAVWKP